MYYNYLIVLRRIILILVLGSIVLFESACKRTKKVAATKDNSEQLAREREDRLKREEAERLKQEQEEKARAKQEPFDKLEKHFSKVAASSSMSEADKNIAEALGMFTNETVPVLIVINKQGETKDYDKPTTIKKYLEYLKDQKKNMNAIENIVFDNAGKIKELELIKK